MSASDICKAIQQLLATKLGVPPEAINPTERFRRLGVDSLTATTMLTTLGTQLGRRLGPTLAWQYPTPLELSQFLAGDLAPAADAPLASIERSKTNEDEPIAIVGLACRFPGAPDAESYWRLLSQGVDAIRQVPADRWDLDALYDANLATPGKMSTRWGGFLEDVSKFDALFFGISPREAEQIDPQQRLMLELAWEALEDAGLAPASLKDTRTGVFFGAMWMDYARLPAATSEQIVLHTATGQDLSIVPARVSYTLGLLGPSVAINTACSSSLVAVHLARQSLLRGESRLALAGGVNLIVSPDSTITMSKFGAMAPDGRSKAFDARANGYVRGEGGGVVALKLLSDALADGDHVYCVIRGTAVNNDGFSNGLTAPSPRAQEAVIRDALADARVAPHDVQYVEAHGTGTMLGDPIEAGALGAVLGNGRDPSKPLRIGSVKTNIGHLEAAAGVAGLIKVALSMQKHQLPATLHYQNPNPHIAFDDLRIRVQAALEPWDAENGRRLAGVSSFGFGGTNAHVLLESSDDAWPRSVRLAATSREELMAKAKTLLAAVRAPATAAQALASPGEGRHRLAVTVTSASDLASQLQAFVAGTPLPGLVAAGWPAARPKVVLLFGGQGSQWLGMGRALLRDEPAARAALERCDAAMRPYVSWSLLERLKSDDATLLDKTDFVQPAIFALQVALSEALRARGLAFDAVIGQSMGEVAAAHVAGALSLDDAARVICVRSQVVGQASGGRMAVVGLSLSAAREALVPYEGKVGVAVAAGPESTVVAGAEDAVAALQAELEARGVVVRIVRVDYASHSPTMDPLLPELRARLAPTRPVAGGAAFWSTVTGGPLDGATLDAEYWAKNLREPVLFAPTVEKIAVEGPTVFVEVDPHPVLAQFVEQCLARANNQGAVVAAAARDESETVTLLEAAGRLFVAGLPIRDDAAPPAARSAELVVLSAKTPAALRAFAGRLRDHVSAHPQTSLLSLASTLASTRATMDERAAFAVTDRDALLTALGGLADGTAAVESTRVASPKVAFVFPGHGSQWLGMGRELFATEPAFRDALVACDAAIQREAGWSVVSELHATAEASRLEVVDVLQGILFAIEIAIAALWRSWGIEPQAVIGHSMGEVAAAVVTGALSMADGASVICRRGALICRIAGKGQMLAVELTIDEANTAIAGFEDRVSVAVSNSPRSTVLSGEHDALTKIAAKLEARGVFCRKVKIDFASHSPQVQPLLGELTSQLGAIQPLAAKVPLYSTVRVAALTGAELDAAYWADNLRQPVRFGQAIQKLLADGFTHFVEISPHPILIPAVEELRRDARADGVAVGSLRRNQPERRALLEGVGALFTHGHRLAADKLFPTGMRRVPLPAYPWQRERYWLEDTVNTSTRANRHAGGHPLLGVASSLSTQAGTWVWETTLGVDRLPWLADHQVQGAVVFPAAAYLEMAAAVGAEVLPGEVVAVMDVELSQVLALPAKGAVAVQVVASALRPGLWRVQIASRGADAGASSWTLHAKGTVGKATEAAAPPVDRAARAAIEAKLGPASGAAAAYKALTGVGLEYGPAFQGVIDVRPGAREALGHVTLPEKAGTAAPYKVHPALLDAAFQVMAVAMAGESGGDATTWLPVGFASLRVLARPQGKLAVHVRFTDGAGGTKAAAVAGAGVGAVAGANKRVADLTLADDDGTVVVDVRGFAMQRVPVAAQREEDTWMLAWTWEASAVPAPRETRTKGSYLLFGDGGGLGAALRASLEGAGHAVVHAATPNDGDPGVRATLTASFKGTAPTAIVHLRSLEGAAAGSAAGTAAANGDADPLEGGLVRGCDSVLATVHAVTAMGWRDAPRLWIVTRGAQSVAGEDVSVGQAPVLGLGRTLAMEHAELRCARVDLDAAGAGAASLGADAETLRAELLADDVEDEIAWRGGARSVARLVRASTTADTDAGAARIEGARGRPYALRIAKPGLLDRLELWQASRRAPEAGEVEIAVEASGVNFLDVLLAMGIMPNDVPGASSDPFELSLGTECAGRVVALGAGVAGLAVGDAVIALVRGSLASHVTAPADLVVKRPAAFTPAQAASVPIVYVTAWYALDKVARLRRGERVLIHAATGGVGLAAVQWAKHVGAEIYATAGTPEKRAMLEAMGVKYVSDSRSDRFVADVQAWTKGEGVDVVLNSLAGDLIEKSFGLLRAYGRFVEIGKRDYYANSPLGLRPFLKNLSFSLVDLRGMMIERPAWVRELLEEVLGFFVSGAFSAPTVEMFPASRAADAFRKMAQARHVGKLAVTFDDADAPIHVSGSASAVRRDATYLVTGGLGGLGLALAGWLAERGAGHLVLAGRAGETTAVQGAALAAIRAKGTAVTVAKVDVGARAPLAAVLAAIPADRPLRGVFHTAGIVDDGLVEDQTPARLRKVTGPKAAGAWNLHALTRGTELDFFVLYASVSGLLGLPAQSNYAAANVFLDALAHHRRAQGLPATSVDWGVFSDVGLAAAQANRGSRLEGRGMASLTPAEGLAALDRVLASGAPQMAVASLNVQQWVEFFPAAASGKLLSHLLDEPSQAKKPDGDRRLLDRIAAAGPDEKRTLIEGALRQNVGLVLRIAPDKIDRDAPLAGLGMDSLMGLELRNRIEAALAVRLAAGALWTYPTIAALGAKLAGDEGRAAPQAAPEAPMDEVVVHEVSAMETGDLMSFVDGLLERANQGIK